MTLATMADRTLPLKARVRGLATVPDSDAMGEPFEDALDTLLADIAAADRLARAAVAVADAAEQVASPNRTDRVRVHVEWNTAKTAGDNALDAYRARMQGVGDA